MRRFLFALIVSAAAFSAQAADKGFYLGASIGEAGVKDIADDVDFDADDFGYKVFGGFRFLDWLGVEAGYVDLGSPVDEILGEDVNGDADALDAFAVLFLPIGDAGGFDLFAKAGFAAWDSRFDSDDLDIDIEDDGTDFAYGIGAQFRLGSAAFRAEYEGFQFGDDADMLSVGFSWTFL
jgi:hypothetical protein